MKVQFCEDNSHLQPGSTGDDNYKFTSSLLSLNACGQDRHSDCPDSSLSTQLRIQYVVEFDQLVE